MSLENLTKEELQDKFELFLFNMSQQQEDFIIKSEKDGFKFDYSLGSLPLLEKYLTEKEITVNDDEFNDAATYFGEVVRKNVGGKWKCSLDEETNGLHYGLPVIFGHSKFDIELSPFHVTKIFILRKRKNHFLRVIENHTNPKPKDISF